MGGGGAARWRSASRWRDALDEHGASGCRCPRSAPSWRALERAARHGAPLAETLAAQARDARFALGAADRASDAARAGPKIQLVVALLLVPSVLLLVAAALASALLDGSADALPL